MRMVFLIKVNNEKILELSQLNGRNRSPALL
jgi:hypothetical protein